MTGGMLPYELRQYRERLLEATQSNADQSGRSAASLSAVESSAESTAADVARLASVVDSAVPAILDQLALAAERLGGVEDLLANPTATASAELYRRGSFALAAGWLEEATADLTQAVDSFPYSPQTWFNLGVAHARQEQTEAAVNAFRRAARYGAVESHELAASAVLLAASLQRRRLSRTV